MEDLQQVPNIDQKSEYVQELIGRTPTFILRMGIYFFFVFIMAILLLANFIRYPDVVMAQARIVTDAPPLKVVSPTSGRLEAVLINENDFVEEEQLIAIINSPASLADVEFLKLYLDSLDESLMIDAAALPTIDKKLEIGPMQDNFSALEEAVRQLNQYTRANDLQGTLSNLKSQISQLLTMNEVNEQQLESLRNELSFRESEKARNKNLFQNGVISKAQYEQSEISYIRFLRELDAVKMNIANNNMRVEQLKGSMLEGRQSNRSFQSSSSIRIAELSRRIRNGIKYWEQNYLIRSPVSGRLTLHKRWVEAEYVQANSELFTVVPEGYEQPYAIVMMPEQNSGKAQIGNEVLVKLNGYNYREFGALVGSIENISLVPNQGFYTIKVALRDGDETTFKKQIVFNQNMEGTAEILLEDLSLLSRIFYNIRSLFKN